MYRFMALTELGIPFFRFSPISSHLLCFCLCLFYLMPCTWLMGVNVDAWRILLALILIMLEFIWFSYEEDIKVN